MLNAALKKSSFTKLAPIGKQKLKRVDGEVVDLPRDYKLYTQNEEKYPEETLEELEKNMYVTKEERQIFITEYEENHPGERLLVEVIYKKNKSVVHTEEKTTTEDN